MSTPGDGRGAEPSGVAEPEYVPWRTLVAEATERLVAAGNENAAQEARWIAERAGGYDTAELILSLDAPVTVRSATFFHRMLDRRVLIPRPETEVLAQHALDECDRLGAKVAVDLGTGSGALALALLAERPGLEGWATDASTDALDVARANLAGLGTRAVRGRLVAGDWFAALPEDLRGRIDLIVTNPPYVADDEAPDLPADVREWEPAEALFSGPSGVEDIERILAEAPSWLARPGAVLVELAPHQTAAAVRLARAAGFATATTWPDLTGRDRILHARV